MRSALFAQLNASLSDDVVRTDHMIDDDLDVFVRVHRPANQTDPLPCVLDPRALVLTGGADGFRDEDILYALRLSQAGVPTDLHVLAGAPHGVGLFFGSELARRWDALVTEWLRLRCEA
jgi:hypothetical protein